MPQLIPQTHAQLRNFTNYDPGVANPPPALLSDLEVVFNNIVQVILYLAGIVAFIYLLIGGFHYLNAGGDPKAAARAKATITYAVWGLILVVIAWIILRLIEKFTGVPVTIFRVNVAVNS
jgi:hypothetical protein